MNRRQVLVLGFAASGLTLLQACGFKLRGTQTFAFDTIAVNPSSGGAVAAELRKALGDRLFVGTATTASSGSSASTAQAQVTLDILQELRERAVAAVNAAGQVRELQLRIRVKFRLRNANGKDLIEETEILQQRDISFNESAVLAKEVEESLLYKNMQSDIVQQLMRRLAAVKSIT
jgi:LPS-assembly lipoprotein